MKCGHNPYWRTHYGNCMACRAERAEAGLKRVIEHEQARESQPGLRDVSKFIAWAATHPDDPQCLSMPRIIVDSFNESTAVSPPAYRSESVSKWRLKMQKAKATVAKVTFDAFGCLFAYAIVDAFFGLAIWLVWMNFGGRWGLPRVAWLDVWCGLMLYDLAVKMLVTPWRIEMQKDNTDGK